MVIRNVPPLAVSYPGNINPLLGILRKYTQGWGDDLLAKALRFDTRPPLPACCAAFVRFKSILDSYLARVTRVG